MVMELLAFKVYCYLFGRHASRLGTPHNDYCRSYQEVDEKETTELCGFKTFLMMSLFVLMNIIRSAGLFREGTQ